MMIKNLVCNQRKLFWVLHLGGWLAWGLVHLMFLVGFRTKVFVMFEWGWGFFAGERGSRLISGDQRMHVKEIIGARMTDP